MPSSRKNYYQILQVDPSAEQEVIEAAWKRLRVKYHPDKNNSSLDSTLKAQDINEAYAILSDPAKRVQYDYERAAYNTSYEDTYKNEEAEESRPYPDTERARQRAERMRRRKEKFERERDAEREREAKNQRSPVDQSRSGSGTDGAGDSSGNWLSMIVSGFFSLLLVFGLAIFGWNWFTTTDFAKDVYEWWTDPHYYAPRLTKDWVRTRVPRSHFVLTEPIDEGAKIEIRFNGDDQQKAIVITRREFHYERGGFFDFRNDNGFVEIRAASPESVGKRYYLKVVRNGSGGSG
jgi:curved DNA-binding protein CbpA